MRKIIQSILKYGIPVVIGVGLIWFLLANVDIAQMKDVMREANYWWFVLVVVVSVFSHIFRAMRWRLQLRAIGVCPSLGALVNSIFGTYAVNLVFPRAGEVWRCGYIASRERASFTKVLGSMVSDRLSDTVTVLVITLFTFVLARGAIMQFLGAYPQVQQGIVSMITNPWLWCLGVVAVAALVALLRSRSQNKVVAGLRGTVLNLWGGFASVARMRGKWQFLGYTVLIWGCYFLQLYIATYAFSFTCGLSAVAVLVLFVLSSIGMGVPTNGGLGAWHMAIIFGLSIYGVGVFDPAHLDARASGFAMLVWGIQTLTLIVLGLYAFASMEVDRRNIASGKTKIANAGDAGK